MMEHEDLMRLIDQAQENATIRYAFASLLRSEISARDYHINYLRDVLNLPVAANERQPPYGKRVLVWCNGQKYPQIGFYDRMGVWSRTGVTYWMTIPDLPDKDATDDAPES
jgi:hypothetical protein